MSGKEIVQLASRWKIDSLFTMEIHFIGIFFVFLSSQWQSNYSYFTFGLLQQARNKQIAQIRVSCFFLRFCNHQNRKFHHNLIFFVFDVPFSSLSTFDWLPMIIDSFLTISAISIYFVKFLILLIAEFTRNYLISYTQFFSLWASSQNDVTLKKVTSDVTHFHKKFKMYARWIIESL